MNTMLASIFAFVTTTQDRLRRRDETGATAVEYALVIGIASVVIVGALLLFEDKITEFINGISFGDETP